MAVQSEEHKQAIIALKTVRGQIDGIINMIEESRYCIDISNQIMSAQSQLRRANKLILMRHLRSCVLDAADDEASFQEKAEEMDAVFDKLMK